MISRCHVCGSSAPIIRQRNAHSAAGGRTTLELCYAHEYVCWDHQCDPCNVCDVL